MADATLDLATVWDQIRERLATSLSPQQNAMLNLTRPLGLVEDTAVLAAPNEFTQTVLESRMRRVLAEALSEQFGRDIRVAVQLEDSPPAPSSPPQEEEPTRRPWSAVEAQRAEEDQATRDRADDGRSAFGVRTDVVGTPAPWDRPAAAERPIGRDFPEIRELLAEAGFSDVKVYWEGDDGEGEGDGEFKPVETGDADPAFICYIAAQK